MPCITAMSAYFQVTKRCIHHIILRIYLQYIFAPDVKAFCLIDEHAVLQLSYGGYSTKEVRAKSRLGVIELESEAIGLSDVTITGQVAIQRKTPVAVSQVTALEIEERLGGQEFPEVLKNTPGVHANKQGGGWGDSEIYMRGFDNTNVATMVNGVPMNPAIDVSRVVLRTERLTLRCWCENDLSDLFAITSADGVGQMMGWQPHTDITQAREMLDALIRNKISFAIILNSHAIGSVGIPKYDETNFPEFADRRCREISFFLSPTHWGQGLATEAISEVIRYLFEDMKLDAIFCGHFVFNQRSAHLQRKLGFKPLRITKYTTKTGTTEDNQVNLMRYEDWQKLQISAI